MRSAHYRPVRLPLLVFHAAGPISGAGAQAVDPPRATSPSFVEMTFAAHACRTQSRHQAHSSPSSGVLRHVPTLQYTHCFARCTLRTSPARPVLQSMDPGARRPFPKIQMRRWGDSGSASGTEEVVHRIAGHELNCWTCCVSRLRDAAAQRRIDLCSTVPHATAVKHDGQTGSAALARMCAPRIADASEADSSGKKRDKAVDAD